MISNFEVKNIAGLSEAETAKRLAEEGFNELPSSKKRGVLSIGLDVVREPMFILLVACGVIYLTLGDFEEAVMLLGFVFVVMSITFYQERKTERALEALKDLSSPRARVIREGVEKRIAGREVVRGDIIILSEGDRVPADARVVNCVNLLIDESFLTGESVSVRKSQFSSSTVEKNRPGGDDLPFVFSGTLVVQGQGIAEVYSTGIHTEIGKIGKTLQTVEQEQTMLQKETNRLVRNLAIIGFIFCVIVVVVYGLMNSEWMKGVLAGVTLAMAILPEEFPVVLTVFLALGAWRISRKQVLTRRIPAVETLGAATVLCVDKTGTLTLNQMSLVKLFSGRSFYDMPGGNESMLPENFHELIEFSLLASQIDPFDPMEKAIKATAEKYLAWTEHIHKEWILSHEYPLSKELLALSRVWKSPGGTDYVIAAKGAPEAIADLCHLSQKETAVLLEKISSMADEGLRVLGVAKAAFSRHELPKGQHDFRFKFIGLIGLSDPVRAAVPAAINECHGAGIRVVMITGDYPGTAMHVAEKIGLPNGGGRYISGPEMDSMSDEELRNKVMDTNIFARIVPEQKLRIVNAFKANGEIVAMTGDGVNDAPALKAAHIGIAMGGRGTDVARESASLVLLDDDFSSIVQAVRLGRRIFDNIKKAIAYIFAIHVPIAGMSLIPVLLKCPLVLMPVHIVFMELIIDPACSVVFEAEPEEADVMKRKPRNSLERLFTFRTIAISVLQGVSVLLIVLAVYITSILRHISGNEARALAFTSLIVANLGLILTNRSWTRTIFSMLNTPNKALWWVIGGTVLFMLPVLYVPFLRSLFKFDYLSVFDIMICFVAGAVSIAWFELLKMTKVLGCGHSKIL